MVLQKNFTLSRNGYLMRLEFFQIFAVRTQRSVGNATPEPSKNLTVTFMVEYHMTKKNKRVMKVRVVNFESVW
jgi:hypothetical protein